MIEIRGLLYVVIDDQIRYRRHISSDILRHVVRVLGPRMWKGKGWAVVILLLVKRYGLRRRLILCLRYTDRLTLVRLLVILIAQSEFFSDPAIINYACWLLPLCDFFHVIVELGSRK